MKQLISAEFAKILSTRTVWGLLAGSVLLAVLGVTGTISTAGIRELDLGSAEAVRGILHSSAAGAALVMAFGIIGMAGEFRQGTITDTFLTTPGRTQVVMAKIVVYATTGLAFGATAVVAALAVAVPWLNAKGMPLSFADSNLWLSVLGAVIWAGLYGAIGVSLGALLRNQFAALIGVFAWLMMAEPIIGALNRNTARWFPGAAARALGRAPGEYLLPMWGGGLMLAGYAAVVAILAVSLTMRRDVT